MARHLRLLILCNKQAKKKQLIVRCMTGLVTGLVTRTERVLNTAESKQRVASHRHALRQSGECLMSTDVKEFHLEQCV
jgi:hypothetical protein